MTNTSGNIILMIIITLYAIWFLAFLWGTPPLFIHAAGVLATILFIVRIARGDD